MGRLMPRFIDSEAWDAAAPYAGAQTNTSLKATPGTGKTRVITWLMISNGATAGYVTLLDGSGGAVLLKVFLAINGVLALSGIDLRLSSDTALCVTSNTVTTHAVSAGGHSIEA